MDIVWFMATYYISLKILASEINLFVIYLTYFVNSEIIFYKSIFKLMWQQSTQQDRR